MVNVSNVRIGDAKHGNVVGYERDPFPFCESAKSQRNLHRTTLTASVQVCVLLNIPLFGFVVNTGGFYALNVVWWIVGFAMINLALTLAEYCSGKIKQLEMECRTY